MPWDRETAQAYAGIGPQHHVDILRSVIPRMFGEVEGQRILDFGCGPGLLTTSLAEAGAAHVLALDESPDMVERARANVGRLDPDRRERVEVKIASESDLGDLGDFDLVLSSLAWMMCETRERLHEVARTLIGLLGPRGRLVVVITHPCFRRRDYGTFRYELPDTFDYWRSGIAYDVHLTPEASEEQTVITDYHWTLTDYVTAITDADAALTRLVELPATRDEFDAPSSPPAYLALRAEPR
jgi:SAM-dependent methyltransferase